MSFLQRAIMVLHKSITARDGGQNQRLFETEILHGIFISLIDVGGLNTLSNRSKSVTKRSEMDF
jgi:hypothetical protein